MYVFILLLLFLRQLEGGISHLPLLDPTMRATPLAPSEWRKRLKEVHDSNCVVLDVRNGIYFLLLTSHSQFSPGFSCRNLLCFIICFCYAVDVSSIFLEILK